MAQVEIRNRSKARSKPGASKTSGQPAQASEQPDLSGDDLRRALDQEILDDFPELTQEQLDDFMKGV